MAGGIDWFRWHHGSVTDPKFGLIARKAGASLPDVLAVWAFVLETASAAADRGYFGTIDAESIDCLFNFPSTETRTADILIAFDQRGLTKDGYILSWEKRQPKRERDPAPLDADAPRPLTSTERSRLHRANKGKEQPSDAMQRDATPSNAGNDAATPREEKSREEKNLSPNGESAGVAGAPPAAPAPKPAKTPKAKKAPATAIPEDFGISDGVRTWAAGKGFNRLDEHLEGFKLKVAAKSYTYADWDAAFKTAIREDWSKVRAAPAGGGQHGSNAGVTVAVNPQYHETKERLRREEGRPVTPPEEVARLRREREAKKAADLAAYQQSQQGVA